MNRSFNFSPDEFYHLYSRGVERRVIFLDKSDYLRFVILLYVCNSKKPIHVSNFSDWKSFDFFNLPRSERLIDVGAYCLMPNHFHLLIRELSDDGASIFMKKLLTAYSMYFNKKYHRTGALFESKFKAQHVDNDNYLKYLFAYIHLNPIALIDSKWKERGVNNKVKSEKYLDEYKYSSYFEYCGKDRKEKTILNREGFPEYFDGGVEFQDFVTWWLNFRELAD